MSELNQPLPMFALPKTSTYSSPYVDDLMSGIFTPPSATTGTQGFTPQMLDPNYMNAGVSHVSSGLPADTSGWDLGGFLGSLIGTQNKETGQFQAGAGLYGLQALSGLTGAWTGMEQLDLAKDQFAFQKDAWNQQFDAQRKMTNSQLEDRQRARESWNGAFKTTATPTAEYMQKYGV